MPTLTMYASAKASYRGGNWGQTDFIQGYYQNPNKQVYYGHCWFSAANLATLRSTINASVAVDSVEFWFKRTNTAHGSSAASSVKLYCTDKTAASGSFNPYVNLWSGTLLGAFSRGQSAWCPITMAHLNHLLGGYNSFCIYHENVNTNEEYSYYVRMDVLPELRVTYHYVSSSATFSANSVNAGSAITMTIHANAPSYAHRVTWAFGSYSSVQNVAAGATTTSFTIPLAWLGAIPNSVSCTATVTLETLSGSTVVGKAGYTFTITAPSTVIPSVGTLFAARVNGDVPAAWGVYVQGKSKATITITGAAGAYGRIILSRLGWNCLINIGFMPSMALLFSRTRAIIDAEGGDHLNDQAMDGQTMNGQAMNAVNTADTLLSSGRETVVTPLPSKLKAPPRLLCVAAYARVSSGKDSMLHSLSAQVSHYNELIQRNPAWSYGGVYADEDCTGTKDERPEFRRLLADCRAGKIDLVLTKSVSRFARNTVTTLSVVRELKALNVDCFFEEERVHSMSGDGELLLTLLASYAQEESLSVSENCKWKIRHGFQDGKPTFVSPFGYRMVRNKLIVVPQEAEIVKMIFALFLSGLGKNAIVKELNAKGYVTRRGLRFQENVVGAMLRNEKYAGDLCLQKTFIVDHISKKKRVNNGELPMHYVHNAHEAIIDRNTFEQVQACMY